ncbi:MAG: dTMP kinase [bacterium]
MRGLLITIEGVDGSGKSTQMDLLQKYLAERGYPVIRTLEPGGTKIGTQIREILLSCRNAEMAELTELLLYAAARAQHVQEIILPGLAAGKIIICDRFTDSTVAYQGYGCGIDRKLIERLNAIAAQGVRPDLTLLFDLDPEQGLARVRHRTGGGDRIEQRRLLFHYRVREGFLAAAAAEPGRVKIIDAAAPPGAVHLAVTARVDTLLRENASPDSWRAKEERT